jgi:hypothetical protein
MRSKIPWPATYPCFTYVEIGRQLKDHQRQTWTFQRTFRAHRTVASTPPGARYWWGSGGLNRNMTIPRQLSLGEIVGKKREKPSRSPVRCHQAVQGENGT